MKKKEKMKMNEKKLKLTEGNETQPLKTLEDGVHL